MSVCVNKYLYIQGEKLQKESCKIFEPISELLQIYNSLDVKFSEFVEQPQNDGFSVWTATEENTGIKVTFKNNSALEWDLELDEETLVAYMTKVAEKYVSQQQEELGLGSEAEDMDENPVVELIRSRISAQYDGAYTDKQIMSNAFYSLFQEAQQTDESEIGWPDWNYWNCTNGLDANLSSVDVEIKSTNTAVAHVVLSYPEAGSFTKVDMPMVYENGNWFVDDIISYEDDRKLSLRKSAESVIMNARQQMTHIQIYFSSPVMCMAGDDCCRDLFSVCLPRGLRSPLSQARGIRCYEDSMKIA